MGIFITDGGISIRLLGMVDLSREEMEVVRLKNLKGLSQEDGVTKMGTSQTTFQWIFSSAYFKTTEALVKGKAIRIEKNLLDY